MQQFNQNSIRLVSNVIKKNKPRVDSSREMFNLFQSKISKVGKPKPMKKEEGKTNNKKKLPPVVNNAHEMTNANLMEDSPSKKSENDQN